MLSRFAETEQKALVRNVSAWNAWRRSNPSIPVELDYVDLRGRDLRDIDLQNANLRWAKLAGANLENAVLYQAELYRSNLAGCNLRNALMQGAKCHGTNLSNCILSGADLFRCDLIDADLSGANFSGAYCNTTAFSSIDLRRAVGLGDIIHTGPSNVDLTTIAMSAPDLPIDFLESAGTSKDVLHALRQISTSGLLRYQSCFISYSQADTEFATALYQGLRANGVRAWYAPEDIRAGQKLGEQIKKAIQSHDKLIVVLSNHSMSSEWVRTEVRTARKRELLEGSQMLFPVSICGIKALRDWELLDSDSGRDLAVEIREYYVPDFREWQDPAQFKRRLTEVLVALRQSSS